MTVSEMRRLAVDYMRQRQRKNQYTQGADRIYFFGKPDNQPGNTTQAGFSDCSSSVRAAIRAASGIDIGYNTDNQLRNRGRGIIVDQPNGVPDAAKLRPGDCLYFGGNSAHIFGAGHVEMYAGEGKLWGHGGGVGPYQSDMAKYCKRRPCIMVVRWIVGDDPEPEPKPTLRRGDTGDAVRRMQLMLIDCDYDLGRWGADGDFGPDTEIAVMLFQAEHNLTPDGVCGPRTWAALENLASGDVDETEPDFGFVIVKTGTWRIRTGPGTQYGTLDFVRAGERLKRTADEAPGWLGVEYRGLPGWISEKGVTV